jgi:uncharacterized protein YjbJ (UPF0337 family)
MKSSTKDQVKGTLQEMKGAAKTKVGQATSNQEVEAKGRAEKLVGKLRKKAGPAKKLFGR